MSVVTRLVEFWHCENPDCGHEWEKAGPERPLKCPVCRMYWWFDGVKRPPSKPGPMKRNRRILEEHEMIALR